MSWIARPSRAHSKCHSPLNSARVPSSRWSDPSKSHAPTNWPNSISSDLSMRPRLWRRGTAGCHDPARFAGRDPERRPEASREVAVVGEPQLDREPRERRLAGRHALQGAGEPQARQVARDRLARYSSELPGEVKRRAVD